MKVVLSGGGTAGHINPALAAAGHLAEHHNAEILFIGTEKGLESKLVPKAGYPIRYIKVRGLIRRLTLKNLTVIKEFVTAISHAKKILKEFGADLVIGTGGYVSAPVLYAAHALGIPTVIHEQNVIPGVTVKLSAKYADAICISFPDTTKYFKPAHVQKCILTGNPIREQMLRVERSAARSRLGLDERPFVVAFGGSLGAQRLNQAVTDMINNEDISRLQFLLGTGQRYYDTVQASVVKRSAALRIAPYIDNMDQVMAAADLVIGRAGALTVSELSALGKPAILIPSPNVVHDHQTYNAKTMADAGAAVMIQDNELSAKKLYTAISSIIDNPEKKMNMAKAASRIGITDGAKRICDAAIKLLE